jgi:hypothetical protein
MADYAYHDPNVATAYGPSSRKYAGYSNTPAGTMDMNADHDAQAIDRGRDQGSQEMMDEALGRAMNKGQ